MEQFFFSFNNEVVKASKWKLESTVIINVSCSGEKCEINKQGCFNKHWAGQKIKKKKRQTYAGLCTQNINGVSEFHTETWIKCNVLHIIKQCALSYTICNR